MTSLENTDAIWGAWRARQADTTNAPQGFSGMLARCLERGVNWIDHADIYDDGAVESLHGEAIALLSPEQRNKLKLITKCGVRFPSEGQPGVRVVHYRSDAAYVRQQVEASLRRLAVEQVDLLLLHRPDYLMRADETARELEALYSEGKVAAYGVSNFSASQFERLAADCPQALAAHQIELSPLHSSPLDDGTFDQAQRLKTPVLAWSPLGGGRLFDKADADAARVREALAQIGAAQGVDDVAAVALAWVKRCGERVIPILGTMNPDRFDSQIKGLRDLSLDPQDWYQILEAARGQQVP